MASLALASPITPEADRKTDPNSISNLNCTAPTTKLDSHQVNVALLQICGGIAGKITKCGGKAGSVPSSSTTGVDGEAKFSLKATTPGATINISKGRWEQCIRAAQQKCGDAPFIATCKGGATKGDVDFKLAKHIQ